MEVETARGIEHGTHAVTRLGQLMAHRAELLDREDLLVPGAHHRRRRLSTNAGTVSPSSAATESPGMFTPLATVSGMLPGKRGIDLEQLRDTVDVCLHLHVRHGGEADDPGDVAAELFEVVVTRGAPAIVMPESTRNRERGTTAATWPSGYASTSSECSTPGSNS